MEPSILDPSIQVLIVEDSETQALKLRYLLEEEGWEVERSATAESALDQLNRFAPGVIIVDYHLPGMNGDELCRRIRMNVRTRSIPILMLTAEKAQGSEQVGLDSGADDYVSKTVPAEILLLRVRALLRKGAQRPGMPVSEAPPFRRARLLAIDDSPTYLAYLADALDSEGYDVTGSSLGQEGIERLTQETFDCVMVDLVMPRMDGIEVCRRIMEINRSKAERWPAAVIMLTSSESEEDMTRGLEAGADDFVGKSNDLVVLKARIRALLRRKFFQEDNQRIIEDLQNKEIETARSRAEKEAELHRELQEAYNELRQTQDAVMQQERLRALGQMSSGIAHDINNAISPVSLYVETLLETEPNLSAQARGYLEIIQRAVGDVAHTAGRLREFYRLREPELALAPVDLNLIVQQVVELTRARWSDIPQQRGIVVNVRAELAKDLVPVAGIESEIREALTNLIFNAVDAMPEGGSVILRTSAVPSVPGSARHVQVEVADTGSGMDEETHRRCLEPFFTTKGERGTGLGLAMVYGVIRRHSAEIEIESSLGLGTLVRLRFAVSTAMEPAPPTTCHAPSPSLRILVVDDDPLLLTTFRDVLERDGHTVVTAHGGQKATDLLQETAGGAEPFAVVITDLGMPHIDGRRVASTVKLMSPATHVILLTGWGQKLIAEDDVPLNVDQVLSKPPRLSDFRAALAKCSKPANQKLQV